MDKQKELKFNFSHPAKPGKIATDKLPYLATLSIILWAFVCNAQQQTRKPLLSSEYYLNVLNNSKDSLYKSILSNFEKYRQKHHGDYIVAIEKCKIIQKAYYEDYDEYNPKEDDFQECIDDLMSSFPTEPDVLLYVAEFKYGDSAIAFKKRILAQSEENPEAWKDKSWKIYESLARQYGYADSSRKAIFYAEKAIGLNDTLNLSLLIARQYHVMKMNVKAVKILRNNIDSTGNSYELGEIGSLLLKLGKPEDALRAFRYARKDTNVYINNGIVAQAFLENKMYTEARTYFVKDIASSNWKPTDAYLQLFDFDYKYGLHDSLATTYRKMVETNFLSDPVGRNRIALFLASPLEPWYWSDLLRILLLFACILVLLIVPYLWVLPVHYAGIYFKQKGHELNQATYQWTLKDLWIVSFLVLLADISATILFGYNSIVLQLVGETDDTVVTINVVSLDSANYVLFFSFFLVIVGFIYFKKEDRVYFWGERWSKKKSILAGIGSSVVLLLFMGCYVMLFPQVIENPTFMAIKDNIMAINKFYHPALSFLLVVIMVPLYEELFFRGIFLSAVKKHLHFAWAIGIQAVFFAVLHEIKLFPFFFLFGLTTGYFSHKSHSLAPGIFLHITNNLLAFIAILFTKQI